jgi:hypothetical protein
MRDGRLALAALANLLLCVIGACEVPVEPVGAQPAVQSTSHRSNFNFTVSIAPANAAVKKGESVVVVITVSLLKGPAENVVLSLSDLPPETTFTLNPPSGKPSFTSILVITTSPETPSGTYHLTITCKNGNSTRTIQLSLTVLEHPWSAEIILIMAFLLLVSAGVAALVISARKQPKLN